MASYQYPYQNQLNQLANQYNQFQQIQQMFPQPQGSVYSINSPLDIGNVPIGSTGLSVALCLNEGLMYIKSFQNSSPVIMTYHITPHTTDQKSTQTAPDASGQIVQSALTEEQLDKIKQIDEIQAKLTKLESSLAQQGGKFDGLL